MQDYYDIYYFLCAGQHLRWGERRAASRYLKVLRCRTNLRARKHLRDAWRMLTLTLMEVKR